MEGIPVDYHFIFIAMSFILLLVVVVFLFVDNTKEKTIAAMLLAGINYLFCMINSFAFFSVDFYAFTTGGTLVHNPSPEMYPLFAIFFLFVMINIVFLFYCYYLWVRNPWEVSTTGSSAVR